MDGFQLILQEYCAHCPEFEPEVTKLDCRLLGDCAPRTMNDIRCKHERKCANVAARLKGVSSYGRI